MRNCAVWVSPWVDREVILDTSALSDDLWRGVVHGDPDPMPKDTVLLIVHPKRLRDIVDWSVRGMGVEMPAWSTMDPNKRAIASAIIGDRCERDPELRKRLRW